MKKIILAILAVLLGGCATSYQPKAFSGGFSETQLDSNVFKVSFQGNGYTSRTQAEEMALLRCAELTLQKGFSYFVIVDGSSAANVSTFTTPLYANTTQLSNGMSTTAFSGGQTFIASAPSKTNLIMIFHEKPNPQVFSYDARFVFESLSKKYVKKP